MRYIKIVFLCDPIALGFMEVDENGNLIRLTNEAGGTLKKLPAPAYSVINAEPDKPDWAA